MNQSPNRGSFSLGMYETRVELDPSDTTAVSMVELHKSWKQRRLELEETDDWKKNNLEYELRSSSVIIEKCKDNVYAQHLYAALCNNSFRKNEVMPILTEQEWSCSWRYAGGIIADIKQEGDYINWYCSGIRGRDDDMTDHEFNNLTEDKKIQYMESQAFVPESVVTDEIKKDLFDLGWLVLEENSNDSF